MLNSLNLFPVRHRVLLLYHRYGPDLPLAIFPVFTPIADLPLELSFHFRNSIALLVFLFSCKKLHYWQKEMIMTPVSLSLTSDSRKMSQSIVKKI